MVGGPALSGHIFITSYFSWPQLISGDEVTTQILSQEFVLGDRDHSPLCWTFVIKDLELVVMQDSCTQKKLVERKLVRTVDGRGRERKEGKKGG